MERVLVCPYGDVNLLVTLCEKLRRASRGAFEFTYVCFTLYEREIYRTALLPHVYIAPGEAGNWLPPEMLAEATAFTKALAQRHLGDDHQPQFESAANHYARRLACEIDHGGYDSVLFFNGRHNLFVAVLDQVADLLGLPKLVFEQGLFRPDYVTIDGRGVNWRNSVDALEQLLSPAPFDYQQRPLFRALTALAPLAEDEPHDYKRGVGLVGLARAYAGMKLAPKWHVFQRTAENRDLLEAACFPAKRRLPATNLLPQIVEHPRYTHVVLCPLQVETDTQVILYSPHMPTMQSLVDHVSAAIDRFNSRSAEKACVIFKAHPMEPRPVRVRHPDAYLINESRIPDLLGGRCDAVITINSTAGIEAIAAEKPVITLGQAFYSFPGVVSSHCAEPARLDEHLASALAGDTTDPALRRRFIAALKRKYQVRLRTPHVQPAASPAGAMPAELAASHANG